MARKDQISCGAKNDKLAPSFCRNSSSIDDVDDDVDNDDDELYSRYFGDSFSN